jgi:hypothetical protein
VACTQRGVDIRRAVLVCWFAATVGGCGAEDASESPGEIAQALKPACAPAETVLGIDIASYQHPNGAAIDWNAVAANRRFVIIKASEGTGYTNAWYADDSTQARAHGMWPRSEATCRPAISRRCSTSKT